MFYRPRPDALDTCMISARELSEVAVPEGIRRIFYDIFAVWGPESIYLEVKIDGTDTER